MTNEYNITDGDVNTEIAKMEDQFVKLGKFLDDRTPEEKLETINKQVEQFQKPTQPRSLPISIGRGIGE